MVTAEALAARRQEIAGSSDLQALLAHLVARAAPLLERLPPIPTVKALLSADGGICPDDGAALEFDPWSPHQHRCPRCGKTWSGERHDRYWARFQHLWVADRAANLIGEFDEGFSNRQTWNDAALAAIAVWFEDAELAARAIESPTGLLAHLARGFGRDGLWYEGENYHLFALRGLLTGAG